MRAPATRARQRCPASRTGWRACRTSPRHRAPRGAYSHLDPDALLDGLNPQQRAAVVHEGGQLLIVAGAGSGKTRVLTHRIGYLLATGRARAGEILAITFTNKAAAEMRERVAGLVGPAAGRMWVSTFHSACVRILRREATTLGLKSSFSIYDAADSQRLITLVTRELNLDPKKYPARGLSNKISDLKNELIDPETYARQTGANATEEALAAAAAAESGAIRRPWGGQSAEERNTTAPKFDQVLADVYTRYQARLTQANALDFDDIIMTTVNLLQAFPNVAEHYRRRFRHIMVDEYQDTNHAQYTLVRELAGVGATDEVSTHSTARAASSTAWGWTRPSSPSLVTPTSPSTRSAAPRSATSSSSRRTTRTPRRSCWSRTTAPRRTS